MYEAFKQQLQNGFNSLFTVSPESLPLQRCTLEARGAITTFPVLTGSGEVTHHAAYMERYLQYPSGGYALDRSTGCIVIDGSLPTKLKTATARFPFLPCDIEKIQQMQIMHRDLSASTWRFEDGLCPTQAQKFNHKTGETTTCVVVKLNKQVRYEYRNPEAFANVILCQANQFVFLGYQDAKSFVAALKKAYESWNSELESVKNQATAMFGEIYNLKSKDHSISDARKRCSRQRQMVRSYLCVAPSRSPASSVVSSMSQSPPRKPVSAWSSNRSSVSARSSRSTSAPYGAARGNGHGARRGQPYHGW